MTLLNTIHKRKSAVQTAIVMALLILSFFFVGMKYLDPPEEMGIEVNFGTSDIGTGNIQPLQTEQIPQAQNTPKEIIPEEITPEEEKVLTQEEESPISVPKTKEKPKEKEPERKPDASTSNALDNLIGAPSNTNNDSTGDGEGAGEGDQGNIDGNPYANSYYGGGSGNGSGYGLNGRSKVSFKEEKPKCNEEGRVVVKIEVNKQGVVTKAIPGVKGSTNTASCLLEPAKKTALSYRFNSDSKAPNKQIGFIIINFSLGQ